MIPPRDPFSRPPLSGSWSDKTWVRLSASIYHPAESWGLLKAVAVVFGLVVVVFPLLYVLFGGWGVAVFIWLLGAVLVVRIARRRRRWARSARS